MMMWDFLTFQQYASHLDLLFENLLLYHYSTYAEWGSKQSTPAVELKIEWAMHA